MFTSSPPVSRRTEFIPLFCPVQEHGQQVDRATRHTHGQQVDRATRRERGSSPWAEPRLGRTIYRESQQCGARDPFAVRQSGSTTEIMWRRKLVEAGKETMNMTRVMKLCVALLVGWGLCCSAGCPAPQNETGPADRAIREGDSGGPRPREPENVIPRRRTVAWRSARRSHARRPAT